MKIRFNKMVKTLSIKKGKQFIGFVSINAVKNFINENSITIKLVQVDNENLKGIALIKRKNGILTIEKGLMVIGNINYKEFKEYMENDILDIKEFEINKEG